MGRCVVNSIEQSLKKTQNTVVIKHIFEETQPQVSAEHLQMLDKWKAGSFPASAVGAVHPDLEHQGHPSPSGILLLSLKCAAFHPAAYTSTSN